MIARSRTFVLVAAIALLLATASDHRVGTSARAAMQMEDQVKAAKTAADHEALAADYDRMAADAKTHAAEHRSMAKAYRAAGGPAVKAQLPEHSDGLKPSEASSTPDPDGDHARPPHGGRSRATQW
jgi:hypothetical protein